MATRSYDRSGQKSQRHPASLWLTSHIQSSGSCFGFNIPKVKHSTLSLTTRGLHCMNYYNGLLTVPTLLTYGPSYPYVSECITVIISQFIWLHCFCILILFHLSQSKSHAPYNSLKKDLYYLDPHSLYKFKSHCSLLHSFYFYHFCLFALKKKC